MKFKKIIPVLTIVSLLILPSCFNDKEGNDYSEWRNRNQAYIDSCESVMENGVFVYQKYTPVWDNSFSILVRWHNDPNENPSYITPLSTSTCHVKYTLTAITGDTLDSSASFECVPNSMITGFMAALCQMRVNDTVTTVIPYTAGYGVYGSNSIPPYTTLIFGIRLDSISKLM